MIAMFSILIAIAAKAICLILLKIMNNIAPFSDNLLCSGRFFTMSPYPSTFPVLRLLSRKKICKHGVISRVKVIMFARTVLKDSLAF